MVDCIQHHILWRKNVFLIRNGKRKILDEHQLITIEYEDIEKRV